MKKSYLFFLLFTITRTLFSQELILNGGFETPNKCSEYKAFCSPEAWYSTAVGDNAYGYHRGLFYAKKGKCYSSFVVADELKKEFIQTWLSCPVEAGKKYRLSFYFRKNDQYEFIPFGIYFSNQFEASSHITFNRLGQSQVKITKKDVFTSKFTKKWHKVSVDFTASITADFMTIGNFEKYFPRMDTPIPKWRMASETVRYYLDEVSLQALDTKDFCSNQTSKTNEIRNHHIRHLHNAKAKSNNENIEKTKRYNLFEKPSIKQNKPDTIRLDTLKNEKIVFEKPLKKVFEKITLPNIFFQFDRFEIVEKYQKDIIFALETLRNKEFSTLTIIGHTDNVGNEKHNELLSLKRAETIAKIIVENGFCSKEKIIISGKGAQQPVADNTTEEGRQINRRVEIFIVFK